MSEAPSAASALLDEALTHLEAHGIDVALDRIDGVWRYVLDGAPTTEGDLIAKAVALGMLGGSGRVQ